LWLRVEKGVWRGWLPSNFGKTEAQPFALPNVVSQKGENEDEKLKSEIKNMPFPFPKILQHFPVLKIPSA